MTITFDEIVPNYARARDRWTEAPTLVSHYEALVSSYNGNSYGLVETVKSFIECVCLTILGEFGKPMPSSRPSTTQLLVATLRVLGLEKTRGASKFNSILTAHNKLADALSGMRNENGPIAHGRDGFLDTLTSNHTRAFLLTGDTILCLLLSALEGKDPDLQFTREPYERFLHLHERIDSSVSGESSVEYEKDEIVIVLTLQTPSLPEGIELRVEPSRLLYSIDRTAYIELLAAAVIDIPPSEEVIKKPYATMGPSPATQDVLPTAEVVPSYDGILSSLRAALHRYLDSLGLAPTATETDHAQLVDSLLATAERNMGVDWMVREALQARMKVEFRRVMIRFDINYDDSETCAEHLVSWFKIQTVGVPDSVSKADDEQ